MRKNPYLSEVYTVLSCLLVTILLLTACSAPAKAPVTAPVAAGPKYGGTLRLAYPMDISVLDPIKSPSSVDRALPNLYTDTLVKWSGRNDEDPKIVPGLATSWDIAPDGLSYTFHLRQGVKWQNLPPVNGREFTSADVKFSFERIMDPKNKSAMASYVASVDRIEVPDKYTVKLILKSPDPTMLSNLCGGHCGMFAREVIEQDGDASKTIIGTGPFMLEKYTPGVSIFFKKNPDYWDKGKPYLDRVECIFMPEAAARLAAFRSSQLDRVVEGKSNTDLIKSSVAGAQIIPGINILGSGLIFSMNKPDKPWADKKVRQAIQYGIDYDGLIQAVLNGSGSRTDYLAPKQFADYGARQITELPKYDVTKAKAMLADAGYPNGFKTSILQHTTRMDAWGGAVEPVAAMLKTVGIDAQIIPAGQADYVARARAGDYELATAVMLCTNPEPDFNLTYMYKTKAAYNRAQYSNPKVDELLDLQRKVYANPSQRQPYVKQIMQILADDVPVIPLFYQYEFSTAQPWVRGWDNQADPGLLYTWHEVAGVWLDKK